MNTADLLELAKQHYIFDASLSKAELIRSIQLSEGLTDCYARTGDGCHHSKCRWYGDCVRESPYAQHAAHQAEPAP